MRLTILRVKDFNDVDDDGGDFETSETQEFVSNCGVIVSASNRTVSAVTEGRGAQFFSERNFQGLDPLVHGEESASQITFGQFGTASSYIAQSSLDN